MNEIDWQAFKAEVAKEMLPLMYRNCGISEMRKNPWDVSLTF